MKIFLNIIWLHRNILKIIISLVLILYSHSLCSSLIETVIWLMIQVYKFVRN